jgi:transposase
MRQSHAAGHKAFVDYSGKKVPSFAPLTGEIRMAEIFIGVLGASTLTHAEASWTQAQPDWIGAHVRMFCFYGRVPRFLVTSPKVSSPGWRCFDIRSLLI